MAVPQSGFCSLADQAALEFGNGTQDHENHLPSGCGCVELFRGQSKLDAQGLERLPGTEQVRDRPGNLVESPDHDGIEPSPVGIGYQAVQLRALLKIAVSGLASAPITVINPSNVGPCDTNCSNTDLPQVQGNKKDLPFVCQAGGRHSNDTSPHMDIPKVPDSPNRRETQVPLTARVAKRLGPFP